MLAIELGFPGGRYHTTPWGRNVNEGVPEWPPSPYRLVRAIIDTWKRKRPEWLPERVEGLLEALASTPPFIYLPKANVSFTKAYLSINKKDIVAKRLIFDAFVIIHPRDRILLGWPDVVLDEKKVKDLDEMLSLLNYLGRSESWINARVYKGESKIEWNSYPVSLNMNSMGLEVLPVAVPMNKDEYLSKPFEVRTGRGGGKSTRIEWLDALGWTTKRMLKRKMSSPPALRFVEYFRSAKCFDVRPRLKKRVQKKEINSVIFGLESKVPPRITSGLEISERLRRKLMGIHKNLIGDPLKVSPKFSGKGPAGEPMTAHRHIYIMPMDMDEDGSIDHVLVRCKEGFDRLEMLALDRVRSLWQPKGRPDIHLVPLQWGKGGNILGIEPSRIFRSETPFIPPRHYRKGRGPFGDWLATEVRREAEYHGLSSPVEVRPLKLLKRKGRDIYWLEFTRSRKGVAPKVGYGFELIFKEAVLGPFTLGYGAHFGLGMFAPVIEDKI